MTFREEIIGDCRLINADCREVGVGFIGVEREAEHFETACRRIEAAYKQPRLFKDESPKPIQLSLDGAA